MKRLALAAVVAVISSTALAENFSCSFGRGACLTYGDIVCTSGAKCVEESAQCFSSYTCDYKGFVCKSKLDDVVDEYDSLVNDYNTLVSKAKRLAQDYDDLASKHRSAENCVSYATSIEDAQHCF